MALALPLDRLQRWMQAVIVDPRANEVAVAGPDARAEVAAERVRDVILPSRALTALERVGIYHDMYLLRMEEALASDYPGLKHLLGDDGFLDLVRGYVQEHPSRHFSLNRLGDHLPAHVGRTRPGFAHDLARLELALTRVFDAPETPALTAEAVATVPPEAWEDARLRPVAAFALLSFRYPVGAYLDALKAEEHAHPPRRRKDTWAVVYRRDYSVWRQDLTRPAYDLLSAFASGRTVGEAIAATMGARGRTRPTEADLFRFFREWTAGGIFQDIVLPDATRTRGRTRPE